MVLAHDNVIAAVKPDEARLSWIARSLHIVDKHGKFGRLVPNNGQLMLHAEIQQQRGRGLPVRIVLLKPRQVGWSTWSEAEGFHDVYHNPNFNAMAVSVDADSTDVIFGMTKRFHDSIPRPLPTDNTNRKALIFSKPHRSAFYAQTAGKLGVGHSFQSRFLHCSEVSYWQDAQNQLAGLYQMVPGDAGTTVILESTANGLGGAFYDSYWQAKERVKSRPGEYRGYRPVFFPWFEFPEYQTDVPEGWSPTSEEHEMTKEYGLSNAQLYWRRLKIEELNGNESLFRQEYPGNDLEAFTTTGHPVFSVGILRFQEKHIQSDVQYGLFDPRTGDFMPNPGGRYGWQYLGGPQDHDFVIGVDTAEYRLSDSSDESSERDFDACVVLDRNTHHVKAIWHGRGIQSELGEQVLGAAKHYNQAWVVPEIPHAMGVLSVLKNANYSQIFSRQEHTNQFVETDSDELGFRTTSTTRIWLINDLINALRADSIYVQFQDILDEFKTFIYDRTGKPIHIPGKHDDLVFALALAIQGDLKCPKDSISSLPERTGDDSEEHQRTLRDLATVGAIDDYEEEDEDDDDHTW